MRAYLIRRLLLVIPTLFGILLVNFLIVQVAPGGPVEQVIAQLRGHGGEATSRFSSSGAGENLSSRPMVIREDASKYRGSQGVDPELIKKLEHQYGFDQPAYVRFFRMVRNYLMFDFGSSFYQDRTVMDLVLDKMPVSISLGFWTTLLTYLISIPLGISKAVRDGSRFDVWSSVFVIIGYAIPAFLFSVLLIVLFAGGSFWNLFPLRGLVSENWQSLPWGARIVDYFWHITLPVFSMVVGGFAGLTMLTKNSFLEEIHKQYVITARSKGLSEERILHGHIFRNAMLIVVAGFPHAFVSILFTSALLIEVIFSLDGIGLLGFEAAIHRDYPVMFGTLYMFTLLGLLLNIVGDILYTVVDPRIDFEARSV
ncbi:putative oligopeptide ABC transporter membrane subunit YejB [Gammaproteobacteria bacterium]